MGDSRVNRMSPQTGRVLASGNLVGQQETAAWANEALQDTVKSLTQIAEPAEPVQSYLVNVINPSTETGLTVKLFNTRSIGGADVPCYIVSLTVPKAQTVKGSAIGAHDFLVQGLFVAGDLDIDVSNDAAVGAAGTFAAIVTIYEA